MSKEPELRALREKLSVVLAKAEESARRGDWFRVAHCNAIAQRLNAKIRELKPQDNI